MNSLLLLIEWFSVDHLFVYPQTFSQKCLYHPQTLKALGHLSISSFLSLERSLLEPFLLVLPTGLLVFSLLSYMSSVYLEIKSLLITLSANIFTHSIGCLFVLFTGSFAMQKLVSLIRCSLFIFVFSSITLGD